MEKNQQQELMAKLGAYEQQIQQLQQQLEAVENATADVTALNLGLDELIGSKGKEIFASIGKGIYAKAKLLSEELLVDVGGKKFVKKSIPETKNLIEKQIKKLEEIKIELQENLQEIDKKLGEELSEAYKQKK